jgi:hypothetical protein
VGGLEDVADHQLRRVLVQTGCATGLCENPSGRVVAPRGHLTTDMELRTGGPADWH